MSANLVLYHVTQDVSRQNAESGPAIYADNSDVLHLQSQRQKDSDSVRKYHLNFRQSVWLDDEIGSKARKHCNQACEQTQEAIMSAEA